MSSINLNDESSNDIVMSMVMDSAGNGSNDNMMNNTTAVTPKPDPEPDATGITATNTDTNTTSTTTTTANTTATTTTTTTTTTSPKHMFRKRPYRRTPRPEGYNDKSSITTTTNTLWQQPLNVYDAIIAESNDLLQAATEAQQLGRYKIASTYLLLLHTRLVGLGKRFDKSIIHNNNNHNNNTNNSSSNSSNNNNSYHQSAAMTSATNQIDPTQHHQHQTSVNIHDRKRQRRNVIANKIAKSSHDEQQQQQSSLLLSVQNKNSLQSSTTSSSTTTTTNAIGLVVPKVSDNNNNNNNINTTTTTTTTVVPTTLLQLPSNIEVDTAMMEHLARAAAELHAARSGKLVLQQYQQQQQSPDKTQQHNSTIHSILSSPHRPTIHYHHHPRSKVHGKKHTNGNYSHYHHGTIGSNSNSGILQSPDARTFFANTANQQGVTNAATVTGVAQSIVVVPVLNNKIQTNNENNNTLTKGDASTSDGNDPNNDNHTNAMISSSPGATSVAMSPIRNNHGSGGTGGNGITNSGRKPVTTAINTVPYANCNARSLLKGASPVMIKNKTTINNNNINNNNTDETL